MFGHNWALFERWDNQPHLSETLRRACPEDNLAERHALQDSSSMSPQAAPPFMDVSVGRIWGGFAQHVARNNCDFGRCAANLFEHSPAAAEMAPRTPQKVAEHHLQVGRKHSKLGRHRTQFRRNRSALVESMQHLVKHPSELDGTRPDVAERALPHDRNGPISVEDHPQIGTNQPKSNRLRQRNLSAGSLRNKPERNDHF